MRKKLSPKGRGEDMSGSPRGPGTVGPVNNVQNDNQVTRGKLRVQAVALAPDAQPSSLLTARRNPNIERARFLQFAPAVAFQARRGRDPGAVSHAHLAEDPSLKDDLLMGTLDGGASRDLEIEAQVIPSRLHRAIEINAEKLAQNFFKGTGSGSLRSRMSRLAAAASLWPGMRAAGFVVFASSGRINEVFVGLERFAETVRCKGIIGVAVGMPAEGQQPEGPFDFILACANRYAQDFVIAGCQSGDALYVFTFKSAAISSFSQSTIFIPLWTATLTVGTEMPTCRPDRSATYPIPLPPKNIRGCGPLRSASPCLVRPWPAPESLSTRIPIAPITQIQHLWRPMHISAEAALSLLIVHPRQNHYRPICAHRSFDGCRLCARLQSPAIHPHCEVAHPR